MTFIAITSAVLAFAAQGHGTKTSDEMLQIAFLKGSWSGKQNFNVPNGTMVGDATDSIQDAVGGRYIEERLSTTLPGRTPTDTRHFIAYDPADGKFKAWWFNDTTVGPMELEGSLSGTVLTLESKPSAKRIFRAVYTKVSDSNLTFGLFLKNGSNWQSLFITTYTK